MNRHNLTFVFDVLKQSIEEFDHLQEVGIDIYDLWNDALDVVRSELEKLDEQDTDL